MSIEVAERRYSIEDERRAIAAVFAASLPPLPRGWSRTLTAGPTAIAYESRGDTSNERISVLAARNAVTMSIGYSYGKPVIDDFMAVAMCSSLGESDRLAFTTWLERHCAPLATEVPK